MRRILLAVATLCPTIVLPIACAVEPPPGESEEQVAQRDDEIIGGTVDTTTDAVVFLFDNNQGAACSGTIIAKNGSTAWVLTAGHCNGMDYVIQADDSDDCFGQGNSGCQAVYDVVDDDPHPNWNGNAGNGYDFRVLRISGAANAPVIPIATNPDGLANGSPIVAVGYGITPSQNSLRRRVTESVDGFQANPPLVYADQTDGTGSCSGDSGGPILFNNTVVGVTSFGDQNCTEYGAYGRVQSVASWIGGITGQAVEETCDDCFLSSIQSNGACGSQANACTSNQDCLDLLDCFDACSTNACYQTCINQHPTGWGLYEAIVDCYCAACSGPCADECSGGSSSSGPGPTSQAATNAVSSASTGPGAGVGGGGVGGSGEGGATGEGGSSGSKKKKKNSADEEEDSEESSSCAVASAPRGDGNLGVIGLGGLGLLAGALIRRRRRG